MAIVNYKTSQLKDPKTQGNAQVFKGFSTQGRDFEDPKLYDIELVKQDLFNHFNIRKGEKLENPDFGTGIWQYLFDPLDDQTKNTIIEDVQTVINYDPRVSLDQVDINEYEHGIQITLSVIYIGYGIAEQMNLLFDQTQGLLSQGSNYYPASA